MMGSRATNVQTSEADADARTRSIQECASVNQDGQTFEEAMEAYKHRANHYNEYLEAIGYRAPEVVAEKFAELGLPRDVRIFNLPCGTGLDPLPLRDNYGYTNFDGLDACPEMVAEAKKTNIFGKLYCAKVGDGNTVPQIAESTYDAVLFIGGIIPGNVKPDAFEEMIRVCKPGGYILSSGRESARNSTKDYAHMEELLRELEQNGSWEKVAEHPIPNYYLDVDGFLLIHKVTKSKKQH